eukprot:1307560-Rhodomonas_salina.1
MGDVIATVPNRGDIHAYSDPSFWKSWKEKALRDFWQTDENQGTVGNGPRVFFAPKPPASRFPWEPASTKCTTTVDEEQSVCSYPSTVATSRVKNPAPVAPSARPGNGPASGHSNFTSENVEIVRLTTENEELRRMCHQLQSTVDHTLATVTTFAQDAKNVASMAHQLAEMQLQNGSAPQRSPEDDAESNITASTQNQLETRDQ